MARWLGIHCVFGAYKNCVEGKALGSKKVGAQKGACRLGEGAKKSKKKLTSVSFMYVCVSENAEFLVVFYFYREGKAQKKRGGNYHR